MSEAAVKQYIKTAPMSELDEFLNLIEKRREEQFKKENFGMSYAEFDAMIAKSRASGFHPAEEVFARLDTYIAKVKEEKRAKTVSR